MSELNFTIKFENNTKLALKELERRTNRALYAMGVKAVEGATDAISGKYNVAPAVDTGRLRASISFITASGEQGDSGQPKPANAQAGDELTGTAEQNTVVVGSNVSYAEYGFAPLYSNV